MKSTGIIRKVDDLGRIVLPIELRRTLDIAERDELEIYMQNDQIILRKYEPACIFCGSDRRLPGMRQIVDGTVKKNPLNEHHSGDFCLVIPIPSGQCHKPHF